MKKAGRASLLLIVAVLALVVCGVVLLFALSGEAPESAASRFFVALSKGDVKTLTDLTYLGNHSQEDIAKQWDFATHVANPYYKFKYMIKGSKHLDANNASVQIEMMKDALKQGSVPEPYEVPMTKIGDHWKVNVSAINRDMYPALPRP